MEEEAPSERLGKEERIDGGAGAESVGLVGGAGRHQEVCFISMLGEDVTVTPDHAGAPGALDSASGQPMVAVAALVGHAPCGEESRFPGKPMKSRPNERNGVLSRILHLQIQIGRASCRERVS